MIVYAWCTRTSSTNQNLVHDGLQELVYIEQNDELNALMINARSIWEKNYPTIAILSMMQYGKTVVA